MAEERIARDPRAIASSATACEAAAAEHRVGTVPLGEPSVVVAVSAAHRGEAFAGAREAIDRIKAEAPIWKKEVEAGGGRAGSRGRAAVSEEPGLTHLDEHGRARMVDVGAKDADRAPRRRPRRVVRMSPETAAAVARGDAPKGDVLGTAADRRRSRRPSAPPS